MAHFAKIVDGVVVDVIVVANTDCGGGDFPVSEPIGQAFISSLGIVGTWLQTSYSSSFRKNYAGVGYDYSSEKDAFVPPKPLPSWVLNESTCRWEAPVPYPTDGKSYDWNESTTSWIEVAQ